MLTDKLTKLEAQFLEAWEKYGLDILPAHQYPIDGQKFDFAWPEFSVVVECNGYGYGHSTIAQVARNAEKVRAAQVLGWTVLTFTSKCLGTEQKREDAVNTVMFFFQDPECACEVCRGVK